MRIKGKKNKGKVEKSNAGKTRLTSAKEEDPGVNDESKEDITGVKNLAGDEFDRKFEMMLVCLLIFVYFLAVSDYAPFQ